MRVPLRTFSCLKMLFFIVLFSVLYLFSLCTFRWFWFHPLLFSTVIIVVQAALCASFAHSQHTLPQNNCWIQPSHLTHSTKVIQQSLQHTHTHASPHLSVRITDIDILYAHINTINESKQSMMMIVSLFSFRHHWNTLWMSVFKFFRNSNE